MKTKIFYILTLIILIVVNSCDTNEPPTISSLSIKLEDVSCTEAWIALTTTNLQLPTIVILKQNAQTRNTINLVKSDTLIYIDSLLPNQSYIFQSVIQSINQSSNELNVTTLDTTSQNFTFEYFEFGDGSSSYFNDVWIFDENNIWAVGDIDLPSGFTNFIQWDGNEWKPRYPYITSSGISGIWAVDTSLIYFASGSILKYQNGDFRYIIIPGNWQTGQRIEKLWGSSGSNIYGVGPWGTIVYYNGVRWTKIEFDTQWYFYNITGNNETGAAYAVAVNQVDDCVIVKIDNSNVSIFYQKSLSNIKVASRTITGIKNYLYISGFYYQNLICRVNDIGEIKTVHVLPLTLGVRQSFALQSNDILYAGEDNSVARLVHFNGMNYKIFDFPQIDPDNYGGIHAIKDLAVSVGFTNNKAYLIIIRRSS